MKKRIQLVDDNGTILTITKDSEGRLTLDLDTEEQYPSPPEFHLTEEIIQLLIDELNRIAANA